MREIWNFHIRRFPISFHCPPFFFQPAQVENFLSHIFRKQSSTFIHLIQLKTTCVCNLIDFHNDQISISTWKWKFSQHQNVGATAYRKTIDNFFRHTLLDILYLSLASLPLLLLLERFTFFNCVIFQSTLKTFTSFYKIFLAFISFFGKWKWEEKIVICVRVSNWS